MAAQVARRVGGREPPTRPRGDAAVARGGGRLSHGRGGDMSLRDRIKQLEKVAPPARRSSKPIPTDLTELSRGFLRGDFDIGDIDPTNPEQIDVLSTWSAALVLLSPASQDWYDANEWAKKFEADWIAANLFLAAEELEQFRAQAALFHRDEV